MIVGYKRQVKILFLITDLKYGGAQAVMFALVNNLIKEGYLVDVACLFGGDLPLAEKFREIGVDVTDLKMDKYWRIDAILRLYQLLRQENYDILHNSLFHSTIIGRIIGRIAKVPKIINWRHSIILGSWMRNYLYRVTSRLDDKVITVSNSVLEYEIKNMRVSNDKVIVIYNGIDIPLFSFQNTCVQSEIREDLGIKHDDICIGFVGRFHHIKGIDVLVNAFKEIWNNNKSVRLLLVGEGKLFDKIMEQSKELGINDRIVFTGVRKDIPDVLSSIDIFVLPSRSEGLPLVLLEAMASGLPVVATGVGGTPEVVIHGKTGFLVPADDVESLTNAITRLVDEPKLRVEFGLAGRERVENYFNIQGTTKKMETLFFKLLNGK